MPVYTQTNKSSKLKKFYIVSTIIILVCSIMADIISFSPLSVYSEDVSAEEIEIYEEETDSYSDSGTDNTDIVSACEGEDSACVQEVDDCETLAVPCDDEDCIDTTDIEDTSCGSAYDIDTEMTLIDDINDSTGEDSMDEELFDENIDAASGADMADIQDTAIVETITGDNTTSIVEEELFIPDAINTSFFVRPFTKHELHDDIYILQHILKQLGLFKSSINGIYDTKTIQAVYTYQIIHQILTPQAAHSDKGFLGPATISLINQDYIQYMQDSLYPIASSATSSANSIEEIQKYATAVKQQRDHFLNKKNTQRMFKNRNFIVSDDDIDMQVLDESKLAVPVILASKDTPDEKRAFVAFDESTVFKKADGQLFTGTLRAPRFLDPELGNTIAGQDIVSIVEVGGHDDTILLQDSSGESKTSTIRIATPGIADGQSVIINYSQNGQDRHVLDMVQVISDDGENFVEFETTHFTLFAVGYPVGFFMINGDATSTDTIDVTLSLYVYGATQMRFSNTASGLHTAQWVSYTTEYNRTLEERDGEQKVYAEFTGLLGLQTMQDTIFVNRVDSELILYVAGGADGDTILDSTSNNFHLTSINNIRNRIVDGYPTLLFDGSANQYAERGSIGLTGYPFTLAAWVQVGSLTTLRSIIAIGDSSTNNVHWAIQLNNGEPSVMGRNVTIRRLTAGGVQNIGDRVHIVGVFIDTNTRHLYVNGQYAGQSAGLADFTDTNQQVRIGRYPGPSAGYFLGGISDARIYTKELSAQEIADLHAYRETIGDVVKEVNVGSFYINNETTTTYSTDVMLNIDASHVTHMKFSNTEVGLDTADWVAYDTGYNWSLDSTPGNKIVYAAFSGAGGVVYTQDNIFYDDPNEANLLLLVDGSMDGDIILDRTNNNYNLTQFNGITNPILGVEEILFFSAGNQYAETGSVGITNYPFTLTAWVRVENQTSLRAVLSIGDDSSAVRYWHIGLVNGQPSMEARNGAGVRRLSGGGVQNIGDRVHISGVFNASNNRRLYVNGALVGTQFGGMTFNGINQQVRIGRLPGTAAGYFLGSIDDARIYNKSLDDQEIADLYQNRIDREIFPTATVSYDTTSSTTDPVTAILTGYSESITILNNGGDNTYTFTGNGTFTFLFQNSVGNIGSAVASVHWIGGSTQQGSLDITGPNSLSFEPVTVTDQEQSLESIFSGSNEYFIVEDELGSDDGYYTTISISSLIYDDYSISNNNVSIKSIGDITTLSGDSNSNVVSALGPSYVSASWPITFLKRDPGSNGGLKGVYGTHLGMKLDIPAFQKPGGYIGTIVYTLYD